MTATNRIAVAVMAAVFALTTLVMVIGGAWLISLGGSWYYLLAGIATGLTAYLLLRRRSTALWAVAALILATLLWSLWEAGLDWWPLASRGDVFFIFGLLLLTPWITTGLFDRTRSIQTLPQPASVRRGGGLALAGTLAASLIVAVVSWFSEPNRIDGKAPDIRAEAANPGQGVPPGEWHAYGRTPYGQRFSPLANITPANVANLKVAWTYHTGDVRGRPGDPVETTFEVTPLKISNRLYFCTPHQNVVALDATTGKEIWRYDPQIAPNLALQHLTCRGLSYSAGSASPQTASASAPAESGSSGDTQSPTPGLPIAALNVPTAPACPAKLFMPTADGRLIVLNPENGEVCSDIGGGTGQIDLWKGMPNRDLGAYYSTSPVVVTRRLVIVGGTVLDNVSTKEQSGVIRAYDINTGALVWNWDPGNPDNTTPLPSGAAYTANSPNTWAISSIDEALGLVYVPLGNQPPDQWGGNRSGAVDRYSSGVVALEVDTGRVRWMFHTAHHDLWDYDVPAQPTLIDLTINGATVPALVQPTKQGEIFVLDRRTGNPILPVTEQPAPQGAAQGDRTAPTQPLSALSFNPPPLTGASMWGATLFDQLACRIQFGRLRYDGRFTPPSTQGSLVYPGNFGVFNWGGVAVDPRRQIAFVAPDRLAFISRLVPRHDDTTLYVQGDNRPQGSLPALNENFGAPFAAQLSPFLSVLGIPCQAPPWGLVAAADLTTGKLLWQHKNGTVRDLSPVPVPFPMGVPNLGGGLVTAGGVAFMSGTLDYYLRAYDVTTGDPLWESRLPAGGQATPMTYTGADGRQYVVVAAGGHGSLGTKAGDAVIAYALP